MEENQKRTPQSTEENTNRRLVGSRNIHADSVTKGEPAKSKLIKVKPTKVKPTKVKPTKVKPAKSKRTEAEPTAAERTEVERTETESTAVERTEVEPIEANTAPVDVAEEQPAKSKPPKAELPKADSTASPKADLAASPKADATASPKADLTASPKTDSTASPKADPTASPEANPTDKKKSRGRWTAIFIILLLIAAIAVGYLVYYFVTQNAKNKVYEDLKDTKQTEEPMPEEPEADDHNRVPTTVDFQSLWNINPEVVAWINVPGTQIDYPVLQSESDDTYYLNHTIEGTSGLPGSIYIERLNQAGFADFNTVLYGHNMRVGTMFAGLHDYDNQDFMNQNHQVIIDTPEQKLTYEIFAAVTYTDAHILNEYNFTDTAERQKFIDSIKEAPGIHRDDVEVNADSQIITLSTCISGQDQNRLLVEAVRVYE